MFRQSFTCSVLLVANLVPLARFRVQGYHLVSPDFPFRSTNTRAKECRLFPVRSPLLRKSRLISVPVATEMFHFATFASHTYVFSVR